MATRRVTSAAQLNQALNQASSGDRIVVASGTYGSLTVNNFSKAVTITSENAQNPATFRSIVISKSANLTLDGLELSGGSGVGVTIRESRNIRVEDSDFVRLYKGLTIAKSSGVQVSGNLFVDCHEDAMTFSGVNGLMVVGNRVDGMQTNGGLHCDMIQVHGGGGAGPSQNLTFRGNVLESEDGNTQGIYIGNSYGGAYRNITIDHNTVINGHHHGITVARTDGLKITNNTVLKGPGLPSNLVHTPKINVDNGSTNVVITNNTAHDVPDDRAGWTVANNNIVGPRAALGAAAVGAAAVEADAEIGADGSEAGGSDTFRFDGEVRGRTRAAAEGVELDAGDVLAFAGYEPGTFAGQGAGLHVGNGGRAATVDSAAGLKTLIARSADVEGVAKNDDVLVLRIEQSDGTHLIRLGLDDALDLL